MTQVIDPKLYTNDELIKTYHQQKEACRELNKTILNNSLQATPINECDNKIAVVRKLNMVESPDASPKNSVECLIDKKTTSTESLKSLEEKATSEKSEKDIKTEAKKNEEAKAETTMASDTDDAVKMPSVAQKSEIVLRVHPIMQETACQTDETAEAHENTNQQTNGDLEKSSKVDLWSTPINRKKHPDELDFDNLSKDLASQLSPSDKLHSILGELSNRSAKLHRINKIFSLSSNTKKTKHFRFLFAFSSENNQIFIRLHFWSFQNQYHIATHEERCINVNAGKVDHEEVRKSMIAAEVWLARRSCPLRHELQILWFSSVTVQLCEILFRMH